MVYRVKSVAAFIRDKRKRTEILYMKDWQVSFYLFHTLSQTHDTPSSHMQWFQGIRRRLDSF